MESTLLQILIAMHRHTEDRRILRFCVDMMAAMHALQPPSMRFQDPAKAPARYGFYTSISRTCA